MLTYIYVLKDPVTNKIRYVGKSNENRITGRLKEHCMPAKLKGQNHKNFWILSLKKKGLKPILQIIDQAHGEDFRYLERYWIRCFRKIGCDLTNATPGGDGISNAPDVRTVSPEHRAKIRASVLKTFEDPSVLAKCASGGKKSAGTKLNRNRVTSTPYVGVTKIASLDNKYEVWMRHEGKRHHVGTFDDPILGAEAYDKFALYYRGHSVKRNFPDKFNNLTRLQLEEFIISGRRKGRSKYKYVNTWLSNRGERYWRVINYVDGTTKFFKPNEEYEAAVYAGSLYNMTPEQLRTCFTTKKTNDVDLLRNELS